MPNPRLSCLLTATLSLALIGCASPTLPAASGTGSELGAATTAETFAGTPLPPGSRVKPDKSFIIGGEENWFGRLSVDIGRDADLAYRFFVQNYPQNGWTLISSVRTGRSLLVYTKGDRTLTIEITETNLLNPGEAVLTVSPTPTPTPTPRNTTPPVSPAGRVGSINVQPIRQVTR